MAVDGWKTLEFEALIQDNNLVPEPVVGKERLTWRRGIGVAILVLVAGVCALLLGAAIGGVIAWYDFTEGLNDISGWKAE